jgi:hypothetical protein
MECGWAWRCRCRGEAGLRLFCFAGFWFGLLRAIFFASSAVWLFAYGVGLSLLSYRSIRQYDSREAKAGLP